MSQTERFQNMGSPAVGATTVGSGTVMNGPVNAERGQPQPDRAETGHPARPRVVAHRGARWLAVENTLEALRIAFAEGADGVEFDVQLTRDGELVLFHDDHLKALGGVDGRIVDHNWRTLRDLALHDRHGRRGRIPHFDDVLKLLSAQSGVINLELKVVDNNGAALTEAVVGALLTADLPPWLLSSFDRGALSRLASCGVPLARALLIDDDPNCDWWAASWPSALGEMALREASAAVGGHLRAVHPHGALVTPERLAHWRGAQLQVNVWTLNEPRQWARAVGAGVDAVITDDPGGMVTWLTDQGLS